MPQPRRRAAHSSGDVREAAPEPPTATDIVREGIDAHVRGDYPRLVALTDRRSLNRWRKFFVDANTRAPSIDEWQRRAPNASPQRLEELTASFAAPVKRFVAALSSHIEGVETLDELHALSSEEVLIRFLSARDPIMCMQRMLNAAYAEAGLTPPPLRRHWTRPARHFQILEEKPVSARTVRVTFTEVDDADSSRETWVVRQDRRGAWRLVVTAELLSLPGGDVTIIDDPVVARYLERQGYMRGP